MSVLLVEQVLEILSAHGTDDGSARPGTASAQQAAPVLVADAADLIRIQALPLGQGVHLSRRELPVLAAVEWCVLQPEQAPGVPASTQARHHPVDTDRKSVV